MAQSYLKYFPKPLLEDLVSGRWLPVVGAGMSLNANLPLPAKMPLWPELGAALSEDLVDFSPNGTLDAISGFQHEFGRARLIQKLTDVLHIANASPGDAHRAFCSIPFDIVCTTNFDFLLERQYDLIQRHLHVVVDEEQLSISTSKAGTQLLKIHGDLRHPSRLVVTEEDYDGFLSRYPLLATYIANLLITKTGVFIGYSLDDPDFRQLWTIVADRLGKTRRMAYAIAVDAKPSDVTRYERRGVKVINLPGSRETYGVVLATAFKELGEHLRDNVIAASQVTEERSLQELQLPRDASTRLCFFSVPIELLSLYKSRVFPIVEEIGFVPVTADDVISPGSNINAKIDALIDRSAVMVVEPTSQWTRAEYDLAAAKNRNDNGKRDNRPPIQVLVVIPNRPTHVPVIDDFPFFVRPDFLDDDIESFVLSLGDALRDIAASIGLQNSNEPYRLLEAKEFRAAVIAAMTLFESWLRTSLGRRDRSEVRRPASLRQLVDAAVDAQILDPRDRKMVFSWIHLRNQVAHTTVQVTRQSAKEVVHGVRRLTNSAGI